MTSEQYIYGFGKGCGEVAESNAKVLGGKGRSLQVMSRLGLPVPSGFTISTEAYGIFKEEGEEIPTTLRASLDEAIDSLAERSGKSFGGDAEPLIVAVRSGASVSMPGMLDTVLNIGLNEDTVERLALRTGSEAFAWSTYCQFLKNYGCVVCGIHGSRFVRENVSDSEVGKVATTASDFKAQAQGFRVLIEESGGSIPNDPQTQLDRAIRAVFRSYNSHRARYYRKTQGIPESLGTAVSVQEMVFGNRSEASGSGVVFSRNPNTGEPGLFGEWVQQNQGVGLASGSVTPVRLRTGDDPSDGTLERVMPAMYTALSEMVSTMEKHFGDIQELEFTIEDGVLYALQCRRAQRTAQAAIRVAVDFVEQGLIDDAQALTRITPEDLEQVLRPVIHSHSDRVLLARGLEACPGAASGRVVFQTEDCVEVGEEDDPVILVRMETSPEDIQGIARAVGILTSRGGQTSHAAVVARGMGKPCVVGCTEVQVDYARELFYAGDFVVRKGDFITIDGSTGEVFQGQLEMEATSGEDAAFRELLSLADRKARIQVRANVDTARAAGRARQFGAAGIGVCRTEQLLFQPEALKGMRSLMLATDDRARKRALNDILPVQREAYQALFEAMDGLPVTIRLFDPPLHGMLPSRDEDVSDIAAELGERVETLQARMAQLHETNPLMGHRGVRVAMTLPDLYRGQIRAMFEAASSVYAKGGDFRLEVLVPLVSFPGELVHIRTLISEVAEQVFSETAGGFPYQVGAMIETPRAALLAEELAHHVDFFVFETRDLTQMTFGMSRDDMTAYMPAYREAGILDQSPMKAFDEAGVGALVRLGIEGGRRTNPQLRIGLCGEHAGEPSNYQAFQDLGIDYVSCTPYRVPLARLASAQAALD